MTEPKIKVFLFGSPRVIASDGTDITPTSQKAKCLIALLATPAGRVWSRAALQDKLWSDRGQAHGRDSLKKELATLRQVFGDGEDGALVLHGMTVQLRENEVRVDVFDPELRAEDGGPLTPEFMEGADVRDPEFEEWLRQFRAKINRSEPVDRRVLHLERATDSATTRYRIALLPVIGPPDDLHCNIVGEMISDRIAISLRQLDLFDIVDFREEPQDTAPRGADFTLRPRILRMASDLALTLLAHESDGQNLIWAEKRVLALESFGAEEVACLVAEVLDQIISAILRRAREGDPERRLATRHALDGIDLMFRLNKPDIEGASRALRRAIEIEPRGPFLAFYAFQTLFRLEKSKGTDLKELREKADELVEKALEVDPQNPISRALVAHVYSFIFRDFDRADTLIRPMISSPPDSPIFFHSFAALRLYTGHFDEARVAARRARDMAQYNPYSYAFATTLAMVDTVDAKLDDAIRHGERVVAMHHGTEQIYEPALRYLAAAYGLNGQGQDAARIVRMIQSQSPDFSANSLNDTSYPVPSEITRAVLREGLGRAFDALGTIDPNTST